MCSYLGARKVRVYSKSGWFTFGNAQETGCQERAETDDLPHRVQLLPKFSNVPRRSSYMVFLYFHMGIEKPLESRILQIAQTDFLRALDYRKCNRRKEGPTSGPVPNQLGSD